MTATQGELFDQWACPRSADKQVDDMLEIVARARGPVPRKTAAELLGVSKRVVSEIVNRSGGEVTATPEGYHLTRRCPPDLFAGGNGKIMSQGRDMVKRAIRERRVWIKYGMGRGMAESVDKTS